MLRPLFHETKNISEYRPILTDCQENRSNACRGRIRCRTASSPCHGELPARVRARACWHERVLVGKVNPRRSTRALRRRCRKRPCNGENGGIQACWSGAFVGLWGAHHEAANCQPCGAWGPEVRLSGRVKHMQEGA